MAITTQTLTKEVQKAFSSYSNSRAIPASNGICTFVKLDVTGSKSTKKILDNIKRTLDKSPYIKEYMIVPKKDLYGNDVPSNGLWIFSWNNIEERIEAHQYRLAIDMETIVDHNKQIIKLKEQMIEDSKELLELKKSLQEA